MRYQLTCGIIARPIRCVIYGPEGIGKTSFAAMAPNAIILDTEEGSHQLPVARLPKPPSWAVLLDEVRAVAEDPSCCSTLVVDTLDAAEQLCIEHVCSHAQPKKTSIEGWGYGKGYVILKEEFTKLLYELDRVIDAGVNVVCTSHSTLRKFERPDELGAFDRFELKLTKHVAPIVKEWADLLLFADYQTYVTTDENGGRAKASGGKRILRTTHSPSWDAKNRLELPEVMDLDIEPLLPFFADHLSGKVPEPPVVVPASAAQPATERPKADDALVALMERDGVTADELSAVIGARGYQPEGTPFEAYDQGFRSWLVDQWANVLQAIQIDRIPVPFGTEGE